MVGISGVLLGSVVCSSFCFFFFQAEDGIRDLVRSRGLGDVYKRQDGRQRLDVPDVRLGDAQKGDYRDDDDDVDDFSGSCLLYTSDAADDLLCVDLGGRRIIKKKN